MEHTITKMCEVLGVSPVTMSIVNDWVEKRRKKRNLIVIWMSESYIAFIRILGLMGAREFIGDYGGRIKLLFLKRK